MPEESMQMTAKRKHELLNRIQTDLDLVEKKMEILKRRHERLHEKLQEITNATIVG